MIKILHTRQIREADAYTIAHEPIASIDLMERASYIFCETLSQFPGLYHSREITVLCGQGNNGGDGLAIARILRSWSMQVKVIVLQTRERGSEDFEINLNRWKEEGGALEIIRSVDALPMPESIDCLVVDAMVGSGLDRPLEGLLLDVVIRVNNWPHCKIAVDMPTGLFAERPMGQAQALKVDFTFTFHGYKLALLLPESAALGGEIKVLDIGLHQDYLSGAGTDYWLTEPVDLKPMLKERPLFSHKGNFGHALLLAGSKGKIGAALLAGRACLASGAGLLTLHLPGCGFVPVQTALPEAMVSLSADEDHLQDFPQNLEAYSALGIGPGLGMHREVSFMLYQLLRSYSGPLVLDADALNLLAENSAWLHLLEGRALLTPHPGEFRRLVGDWKDDYEKLAKLKEMAMHFKLVIVLKGAFSVIALPDGSLMFNPTGNPGMAKGGSGDVLTGLLCGLLAQGYALKEAALLGTWLHGTAGDLAAEEYGTYSMLAGHICEKLGEAYRKLKI